MIRNWQLQKLLQLESFSYIVVALKTFTGNGVHYYIGTSLYILEVGVGIGLSYTFKNNYCIRPLLCIDMFLGLDFIQDDANVGKNRVCFNPK